MKNEEDLVKAIRNQLLWWRSFGLKDLALPTERPASQVQRAEAVGKPTSLEAIRAELGDCRRCRLHTGRQQIVFGTGDPKAKLFFVGEAPGEEEDLQGRPFVGRAGQLLTRMIEAMGLTREEVYITNIIKCRPPQNRNPLPDEISECRPFLSAQLDILRPKVICALGTFASQTLLNTQDKISHLRGRFHDHDGILVMPTYHPAYLLRNPQDKRLAWKDMQMIMDELRLLREA